MVYESDFYTTRRAYSRPTISSYSVSYPYYYSRYYPGSTRVYTTSYPIYTTHSLPYVAHKRLVSGTRILSSPVRLLTSHVRYVRSPPRYIPSILPYYYRALSPYREIESPPRVITTTTTSRISVTPSRIITTPSRLITTPDRVIYTPSRVIYSPPHYIPSRAYSTYRDYTPLKDYYPYTYRWYPTLPSVLSREYARIANKYRTSLAYRPLEDYLNSDYYKTFDDEKRRIRAASAQLMREIHSPVPRSKTPFPISRYEPITSYALDAYISRVQNPTRYAQDFNPITYYPDPPRFCGTSHLASIRICGDRAYSIRNPLYDPDRVRLDIAYLSHYLKNRRAASEKSVDKVPMDSASTVEIKEVD